jgi:hypothetical protein
MTVSLIAFRSLDDGTVAGAAKGLVDSARRAAPDLIADTEDSDALSAYIVFGLYIGAWAVPDAPQWGRLDRAIANNIFTPGENLLVIDCSWEGEDFWPARFLDVHRGLAQRNIPLDTVAAITMCRNLPVLYESWAKSEGLTAHLKIYSYWGTNSPVPRHLDRIYQGEKFFQRKLEEAVDRLYGAKPQAFRFLCLNNLRKPWRLSLALLLRERFPTNSLVSFGRIAAEEIPQCVGMLRGSVPDGRGSLENRLRAFAAQTPLILDIETGDIAAKTKADYDVDPSLYWRSAISIVTESDMSSRGQLRVTEKTFKPLGLFHPFLIAGTRGALQALRDEGFRTFRPFMDEGYDDIPDGPERLRALQREILRLGAMSDQEVARGLRSMAENILHNACHLRYMYPHVDRIHVSDILQRMRRDFGPRFGYGEPTLAQDRDRRWDAIEPIVVEEIAEIRFDGGAWRLEIVPRRQFDANLSIFTHTTIDGAGVIRKSHYWPIGAKRLVIDLPKGDIKGVVLGQFTVIDGRYHNMWQRTIERDSK